MAKAGSKSSAVVDALAVGQIDRASLLLSEGSPLDLRRATKIIIYKGQYEAMKFLLSNYKVDVDKQFLLHRALLSKREDIARLLVEAGADVNNYAEESLPYTDKGKCWYFRLLPLQLSLYCSRDMTNFLLESGADVNKRDAKNQTPLIYACLMSVDADRVALLLENGANFHFKDADGMTALRWASIKQNTQKLTLLIDLVADIEEKDECGRTFLMSVCSNPNDATCLKILLERGADCRAMNLKKETALHEAAKSGNSMALKLLIQYGAQLEAWTYDGDTALILAYEESVPAECVRILLENGAFPNVKNKYRETLLSIAKDARNKRKIQMLLQYGATEEDRINQRKTDLMLACGKPGKVKSVLSLLQNGVSPNAKNYKGETALHIAADTGDIEILELLVQYKADVNAMTDDDVTPLMLACANRSVNVETVKFLLEKKASPNLTNIRGETALHHLVLPSLSRQSPINLSNFWQQSSMDREVNVFPQDIWCEISEKIKLLVKHGADIEARTAELNTPFHVAVQTANLQLIELFQDLGADVYAENGEGQNVMTCLVTSARNCDLELIPHLVEKGVSVNHRNKFGKTPLMLAARYDHVEMLRCLIKAGADVHAVSTDNTERGKNKITALSVLLDDTKQQGHDFTEELLLLQAETRFEGSSCAEELIRHGAVNSLPERYNSFLHQLVRLDRRKMIQVLLTNGMAPTMSDSEELLLFGPSGFVSPFTVALDRGNIPVIQYLLGNLMLCPCDIYGHSYFSQWRHKLIYWYMTDVEAIMDEFYSQPKSLFQLSFVTVSHALGGVPGRMDRVNSLPLPSKVKDKLLFKSIDVLMEFSEG